ncbi:4-hydroxy-tetrahydrodipicolinate synthase [Lebetimonas natsushimae]|uniref:4-hydroxy-tetrahydrodipicolinate synthase n=1 Tax=Lebetimonas natsushimae TaxID=1936991 RepID=A0A292YBC5_9BACT|nr:4-hydroxy-tetrahydrodipicolinate synthase [Lebetimonas natsushimae]GAX88272.1 4-hydroxy-tetrahydrodipicolinate synthase [Lebetimonas natsushimae]
MQGAMTALITPFKNGKVDEETYAKLIERQIVNGIDYVVPVGTTGESATLTHDEHKRCIEIAVEVCKGRAKVLAGAGSNSTHEAIDLAKFAESKGADAILSVAPYYNKPTQSGIYAHYKTLAESISIPVVLYNVPGRTCSNIEVDTAVRLFNDVENIVAIKEATGKIENVVALKSKSGISVISGDDAINYPIMATGGNGCISVTSNLLPNKIADLIHAALKGDFETSREINEELYELNKILFIESNPIPIKYAMYEAGLIPSLEYRLPLTPPSEENKKKIKEVIKKYL